MKQIDEVKLDDRTTLKTFEHQIEGKPVWIHLTQYRQFDGRYAISTNISDSPVVDEKARKTSKKPE